MVFSRFLFSDSKVWQCYFLAVTSRTGTLRIRLALNMAEFFEICEQKLNYRKETAEFEDCDDVRRSPSSPHKRRRMRVLILGYIRRPKKANAI